MSRYLYKIKLYCFAFTHRLSNPLLQFLELTSPTLGNTNHVSLIHTKIIITVYPLIILLLTSWFLTACSKSLQSYSKYLLELKTDLRISSLPAFSILMSEDFSIISKLKGKRFLTSPIS